MKIGQEAKIQAAMTCKECGVWIIALAHGSLPGYQDWWETKNYVI
jgi:stage III sporulation protein SpoIIIAA